MPRGLCSFSQAIKTRETCRRPSNQPSTTWLLDGQQNVPPQNGSLSHRNCEVFLFGGVESSSSSFLVCESGSSTATRTGPVQHCRVWTSTKGSGEHPNLVRSKHGKTTGSETWVWRVEDHGSWMFLEFQGKYTEDCSSNLFRCI